MALAIFDLDETLISTDSDHEWGQYVADKGLVEKETHQHQNDYFYKQYKAGNLDIDAYLKFACGVLARHPLDLLNEHLKYFVTERIKPRILPQAVELIDRHRQAGDYIMVITSTIEFVTRPIVDLFEIETLLAPNPEFSDGRYTGLIKGVPSFGQGKVTRLLAWLENNNHDLHGSYFYSDSHNDLPLLNHVDHPVAVDPDPVLRDAAKTNGWEIISLR